MKYSSFWLLAGLLTGGPVAAGMCDFYAGAGAAVINQMSGKCTLLDGGRTDPKEGREKCAVDGTPTGEFVWKKGKRNGPGWFIDGNRQRAVMVFRDGQAHGAATLADINGKRLCDLVFVDNRAEGLVREFHPSGQLREVTLWKNGKKTGTLIGLTEAGEVTALDCAPQSLIPEDKIPCGHDGKLSNVQLYGGDGKPRRSFLRFQNGVIKAQTTTDLKGSTVEKTFPRAGDRSYFLAKESYPDGKLFRTYTSNNHFPDGSYVEYAPSGQKQEESVYADRLLQKRTLWYLNGQIKSTLVRQSDGSQDIREYFDNGKLALEGIYALRDPASESLYNRIPNGKERQFRENGTPKSEATYVMGQRDGITRLFHGNGKVAEEAEYRKDRLLSRVCYGPSGSETLRETYFEDGSRKAGTEAVSAEERRNRCNPVN